MIWSPCRKERARGAGTAVTSAYWGKLFAMRLNPPTIAIFLISLTLAILALITKLGFVGVPRYLPHQEFWLAITAYVTLMVGNLVRGV
jgi:hypothetical protein